MTRRKAILLAASALVVGAVLASRWATVSRINRNAFRSIELGFAKTEVEAILGPPLALQELRESWVGIDKRRQQYRAEAGKDWHNAEDEGFILTANDDAIKQMSWSDGNALLVVQVTIKDGVVGKMFITSPRRYTFLDRLRRWLGL
jgi:hypothetical protein